MAGINTILSIGRDSLLTHQMALTVTGHNISNINTPGYTRQRVNLETPSQTATPVGTIGNGVQVNNIQRMVDRFTETRINQNLQEQGRWQAEKQSLEPVETIFTETGEYGLSQSMNAYWNAWQDVANNPSGTAERASLIHAGSIMSDYFNQSSQSLAVLRQDMDTSITNGVARINAIAGELTDLNKSIYDLVRQGQSPNDLLDQRDRLLQDLSDLIDFSVTETDSKLTVSLGDGKILVGDSPDGILATVTNADGHQDVVWEGSAVPIHDDIASGSLRGWLNVRDTHIPEYADRLDELANSIITQVNALHQAGFGLDGSTGNDFFAGTSAGDIQVRSDMVDDPGQIAASQNGDAGDNRQALAIAALSEMETMTSSTQRFDQYHAATLSLIGNDVRTATSSLAFYQDVGIQLQNYRESVSGVSLDEEMISLMKYQQGYSAAAKLITTADEMFMDLLNMVS